MGSTKVIRLPDKVTAIGPNDEMYFRDFPAIADALEDLFAYHGTPIKKTSQLEHIFNSARRIGAMSPDPSIIKVSAKELFDAYCFARLANSALALDYSPRSRQYCFALQDGTLNFWNSERSKAKDTEWELYLWGLLNRKMPKKAELFEPDILVHLPFRSIGIACKKAYSQDGIIRQIERGAHQIRRSGIPGLVAISLDYFIERERDSYSNMTADSIKSIQSNCIAYFDQLWSIIGPKIAKKYLLYGRIWGIIFAIQGYMNFTETPNSFMELFATRFQTDGNGPSNATEVMDLLHASLSAGTRDGVKYTLQRLDELKKAREEVQRHEGAIGGGSPFGEAHARNTY